VRSVTGGTALLCDVYQPDLDEDRLLVEYRGGWHGITWWLPSLPTLCQMVVDAGFSDVRIHSAFRMATTWDTSGYWRAVMVATP